MSFKQQLQHDDMCFQTQLSGLNCLLAGRHHFVYRLALCLACLENKIEPLGTYINNKNIAVCPFLHDIQHLGLDVHNLFHERQRNCSITVLTNCFFLMS